MSLYDTFWEHADRQANGCLVWNRGRMKAGYGELSGPAGRVLYAHRVAWELVNGPIPDGLNVLHKCDNRPCIEPTHLFLGTKADNNADGRAKGRMQNPPRLVGEAHPMARLTADDVRTIRQLRDEGVPGAVVAARFRTAESYVSAIYTRRMWKTLD